MSGVITVLAAWGCILLVIADKWRMRRDYKEDLDSLMQERRDLLDRIQAPSFAEYSNKVIREKKAEQKPEEKQDPIEFIS